MLSLTPSRHWLMTASARFLSALGLPAFSSLAMAYSIVGRESGIETACFLNITAIDRISCCRGRQCHTQMMCKTIQQKLDTDQTFNARD
jgi:hypothetical protein